MPEATLTRDERKQLKDLLDCYTGWAIEQLPNGRFRAIDQCDRHSVPGTEAETFEECQRLTLGVALKCAQVICDKLVDDSRKYGGELR